MGGNRSKISRKAMREAVFLECRLPLRAFATLTLPHDTSRLKLDSAFNRWIDMVQAESQLTLGWIKAYENDPARHAHAILIAAKPLNSSRAEILWNQVIGARSRVAAKVAEYQPGIGGLAYVLKTLDDNADDIQFSRNLSAFVPDATRRFFGIDSPQRRQIRRIQAQFETAQPPLRKGAS